MDKDGGDNWFSFIINCVCLLTRQSNAATETKKIESYLIVL
jgi:hypothetical protein